MGGAKEISSHVHVQYLFEGKCVLNNVYVCLFFGLI